VGYSLWEAQAYRIRRETVAVLPAGSPDLRVLHLSDIHLMPGNSKRAQWLSTLVNLEPDLVINTGDNLAHADAIPDLLDAFGGLLDKPGAFVFGSNDYFAPVPKNPLSYIRRGPSRIRHAQELPWQHLQSALESAGWKYLGNHRHNLTVGPLTVELIGVDDPHLHRDDYAAVEGPASAGADVTLGITHAPYLRILDAMTRDGAAVIFAGHTHGGQICLPGYGTLITNCDLDAGRAKGLSMHQAPVDARSDGSDPTLDVAENSAPSATAWLEVSAGIGTSPFTPIRLACRPEAVLITLTALG
jgi:predicted MPP superfamily phosphohydrolase